MARTINVGTLISGGGTNLQAIIDACAGGSTNPKIDARILFTGSDTPGVKGLDRAKKAGIDTFVVDYAGIIQSCKQGIEQGALPPDFDMGDILEKQQLVTHDSSSEASNAVSKNRIEFFLKSRAIAEKKLLDHILSYKIDLLVLAGFMRVLTPYFIDRLNTVPGQYRIMNIHPALLPSFPGTDGYGDTFRYGCKIGGCTVHFIDYGEDTGPIIGQKAFEIEAADTLDDVKRKGLEKEWELYPACIQKFAESF
ncbi:MAG: phosphoribosylglycinamide formyltransferase [Desulfobacteraceae bacterium]|nr:phosphoribosylglycinamide formyltransferase [Desulfobacteraceae bacterium]